MILYLLDSGPLSALLRGRRHIVALVQPWIIARSVATSVVRVCEVVEYLKGLLDYPRLDANLRLLTAATRPIGIDYNVAGRYADLRRGLRPPFGPGLIGDLDTLISAIAMEHDLTLVTMDRDFIRIPDLKLLIVPRR